MKIEDIKAIGDSCFGLPREKRDEAWGLFAPSLYYAFFERLTKKMKFHTSVVLGVCGGGDVYHLCKGNKDGTVIGVDIQRDHLPQIEFIEANFKGFQFWHGDSVESAPKIYQRVGPIDFLFVDSSHTTEQAIQEFEAYLPFLTPNAVVAFDDLLNSEMTGLWESLPDPKVRMDFLHDGAVNGGGFGILLFEKSPLIPPLGPELGN